MPDHYFTIGRYMFGLSVYMANWTIGIWASAFTFGLGVGSTIHMSVNRLPL